MEEQITSDQCRRKQTSSDLQKENIMPNTARPAMPNTARPVMVTPLDLSRGRSFSLISAAPKFDRDLSPSTASRSGMSTGSLEDMFEKMDNRDFMRDLARYKAVWDSDDDERFQEEKKIKRRHSVENMYDCFDNVPQLMSKLSKIERLSVVSKTPRHPRLNREERRAKNTHGPSPVISKPEPVMKEDACERWQKFRMNRLATRECVTNEKPTAHDVVEINDELVEVKIPKNLSRLTYQGAIKLGGMVRASRLNESPVPPLRIPNSLPATPEDGTPPRTVVAPPPVPLPLFPNYTPHQMTPRKVEKAFGRRESRPTPSNRQYQTPYQNQTPRHNQTPRQNQTPKHNETPRQNQTPKHNQTPRQNQTQQKWTPRQNQTQQKWTPRQNQTQQKWTPRQNQTPKQTWTPRQHQTPREQQQQGNAQKPRPPVPDFPTMYGQPNSPVARKEPDENGWITVQTPRDTRRASMQSIKTPRTSIKQPPRDSRPSLNLKQP